jgi:hypothetical protein
MMVMMMLSVVEVAAIVDRLHHDGVVATQQQCQ